MTLNERLQEAYDKRVFGTAMTSASDLLSAMTAIEQAESQYNQISSVLDNTERDKEALEETIAQQAEAIRLKDAALAELKDLMEDVYTGNYHPDSFTTQPARIALAIQPSPDILQARDERVAGACVSVIEEVIASFGKRSLVGVTKTKICLQMVI